MGPHPLPLRSGAISTWHRGYILAIAFQDVYASTNRPTGLPGSARGLYSQLLELQAFRFKRILGCLPTIVWGTPLRKPAVNWAVPA